MLYRRVRPVFRDGSSNRHFQKRIPSDVRRRAIGLTLDVPVGDQRGAVTITERTASIRLSLRTSDPREVKRRAAAVDSFLENVWQALRQDEPVALTHKQAVALAGKILDAIQGHSPRTEGGKYGGVTLQAQAKALALFPRFRVSVS